MGACAGDVDNDGRVDLYVTGYGANALYRNDGDGVFSDVTREAGVGLVALEHELRVPRHGSRRRPGSVRRQLPRRAEDATTGSAATRSGGFASTAIR